MNVISLAADHSAFPDIPGEKSIIEELPQFFEMVEDVSLEDMAERFEVNSKAIKKLC